MSAFTIQSYNLFRGRCPHLSVFLPQKEIICSCDKMTLVTMPHKRGVGPAILYIQGNNYLFIIIYIASPFLSNDTVIFVILSQTSRKLHFAPTKVAISPRFHAKKNCLSWQGIQNSRKPFSFAPESHKMPRRYIPTSEAKTSALRCLKNETLKFFEFYFTKFDLFV